MCSIDETIIELVRQYTIIYDASDKYYHDNRRKGNAWEDISKKLKLPENPQNLPKLPMPQLRDTLQKYLISLKPTLSNDEYCDKEHQVQQFQNSPIATQLQKALEKRANEKLNWFEEWFVDMKWLCNRASVVTGKSPGKSFPLEDFVSEEERLSYTAKLILACASYKILIDSKTLIYKTGGSEQDMKQHENLFGTCRIPAFPSDIIEFNPKSEHIVIAFKNHFFKLPLLINGKPISKQQILQHLKTISSQCTNHGLLIGILTSENRDIWGEAYKELIETNYQSVRDIQTCLFLVCLDDPILEKQTYACRQTKACLQLVHGGGPHCNSANRWFDSGLQFIIASDGIVGLNYEHSGIDGLPIANMVDFVYAFIKSDAGNDTPDNPLNKSPQKLHFQTSNSILRSIKNAEENLNTRIQDFHLECYKFENFGKEWIKNQNISPDSFFQMALQLTLFRLGKPSAVHTESVSIIKFIGGRTDSIKCNTQESSTFVKTMLDSTKSVHEKSASLKAAVDNHKRGVNEVANGRGTNGHLLGLSKAAEERGIELSSLLSGAGYVLHKILITSQAATKCDGFMIYGNAATDGYACCYNIRKNDINIAVSSSHSCPKTDSANFIKILVKSLCRMHEVLVIAKNAKL